MILFFFKKAIRENLQDVIVTPTGRVHESGHPARAACVWIPASGKGSKHPAGVALHAGNPERRKVGKSCVPFSHGFDWTLSL